MLERIASHWTSLKLCYARLLLHLKAIYKKTVLFETSAKVKGLPICISMSNYSLTSCALWMNQCIININTRFSRRTVRVEPEDWSWGLLLWCAISSPWLQSWQCCEGFTVQLCGVPSKGSEPHRAPPDFVKNHGTGKWLGPYSAHHCTGKQHPVFWQIQQRGRWYSNSTGLDVTFDLQRPCLTFFIQIFDYWSMTFYTSLPHLHSSKVSAWFFCLDFCLDFVDLHVLQRPKDWATDLLCS